MTFTSIVHLTFLMCSLSILCWNVRGIMSSTVSLCELLNVTDCDIAVLCEHKLKDQTINFLNSIDNKYTNVHKVSEDCGTYHYGKAGVAIMFKKNLSFNVTEVEGITSDRIVGLELKSQSYGSVFIFSVYLPAESGIIEYRETLDIINSICTVYQQYGHVVIAGDFNASHRLIDKGKTNTYKSIALSNFIDSNSLVPVNLDDRHYTYIPTKTMLDYILVDNST